MLRCMVKINYVNKIRKIQDSPFLHPDIYLYLGYIFICLFLTHVSMSDPLMETKFHTSLNSFSERKTESPIQVWSFLLASSQSCYSRTRLETLYFEKFKGVSQRIGYPICFLLSSSLFHESILASKRKIVFLIQVYEYERLSLARFPERKRNGGICFCSCDTIGGYWITPSTNCTHLTYLIESSLFFYDDAISSCC